MPPRSHREETGRPDAVWVTKVALGALFLNYVLGPFATVMFFAGWLWAVRSSPEEID